MRLAWEMVCERIEANGELGGRKSQKLEEIVFSPWCWLRWCWWLRCCCCGAGGGGAVVVVVAVLLLPLVTLAAVVVDAGMPRPILITSGWGFSRFAA
jgi:hypothetical protein